MQAVVDSNGSTLIIQSPGCDDLASMSKEQLRAELIRLLGVAASDLMRMGKVVCLLDKMGEDLHGLKIGLVSHLRRIGQGQMLPEVVVMFAGSDAMIRRVGSLPLSDQKKLVEGGTVELLVGDGKGGHTYLAADPMELTGEQIDQVFAKDHLRNRGEQKLILELKKTVKERKRPTRIGIMEADRERRGAVVKGKRGDFIPLADLKELIKAITE